MERNPFEQPTDSSPLEAPDLDLAGRADRFGAAIIDRIALVGPVFALVFVVVLFEGEPSDQTVDIQVLLFLIWWLGFTLYQWYWISTDGTTIGKRRMGIRVIHEDGRDVGFLSGVVLREWILGIPRLFFGWLGALLALFDVAFLMGEQRKCLHDWFASTVVVHDRRHRPRRAPLPSCTPAP